MGYEDEPTLRCVSDYYDPDGSIPYRDVEDFLDMCRDAAFRIPTLERRGRNGNWYEVDPGRGSLQNYDEPVLVPWVDE